MFQISEDKVPKLWDLFQELVAYGLWSRDLPPPDPQMLDRIYRLDLDIFRRTKELYLPEEGGDDLVGKEREKYFIEAKQNKEAKQKQRLNRKKKKKNLWEKQRSSTFSHLGQGVSSWLDKKDCSTDTLKNLDLPVIKNASELAQFLDEPISALKWLSYHHRAGEIHHYTEFQVAKKSGGSRCLSAPKPRLKNIQKIIKEKILDNIPINENVFGFRRGLNIFDNAIMHIGAEIVVNIDIKDFFPSIHFPKIRRLFADLGYSGEIATVLALLCTKPKTRSKIIENTRYFSFSNHRYLPQGAPTSPSLSNLVVSKLDEELSKRAKDLGFLYSRYADDMSFSTSEKPAKINELLYMAKRTLEYFNFHANEKKTKVLFQNNRQEITGLTINSGQPKIPRSWRRNLRSQIHHFCNKDDISVTEVISILSSLNYLRMTHPFKVERYMNQVQEKLSDLEKS